MRWHSHLSHKSFSECRRARPDKGCTHEGGRWSVHDFKKFAVLATTLYRFKVCHTWKDKKEIPFPVFDLGNIVKWFWNLTRNRTTMFIIYLCLSSQNLNTKWHFQFQKSYFFTYKLMQRQINRHPTTCKCYYLSVNKETLSKLGPNADSCWNFLVYVQLYSTTSG